MKIAVIGATGLIGKAVTAELIARGHQVIGISRHADSLPKADNFTAVPLDVNSTQLVDQLTNVDAVISAFNGGWENPNLVADYNKGMQSILQAAQQAAVPYLLIVGSAGCLYVAPNLQLVDTKEFPEAIYPAANAIRQLLIQLKQNKQLNWAFVSPAAMFAVNPVKFEATGHYRIGGNHVLLDKNEQPADISLPDLAAALADDAEQKAHLHQHFTISE
ncbi:NAD(P)-dependent oxidoreductase [Gallibacterium anatis]|uniref:NAD(P)-dependent oxidoreductase n=1 Tax=Gallibacterium anatis TaxID=750 RepID=UPI0039FD1EBC